MNEDYVRGVEDAIRIIEERGKKIRGAIQPGRTIQQIRERLLNFVE